MLVLPKNPHPFGHHPSLGQSSVNDINLPTQSHRLPHILQDLANRMKNNHQPQVQSARRRTPPSSPEAELPERPQLQKRHTFNRAVGKVTTRLRRVKTSANLKLHNHLHQARERKNSQHDNPCAASFVPLAHRQYSTSMPYSSSPKGDAELETEMDPRLEELLRRPSGHTRYWCNNQRKLEGACNFFCGTCDWASQPVFKDDDEFEEELSASESNYLAKVRQVHPRRCSGVDEIALFRRSMREQQGSDLADSSSTAGSTVSTSLTSVTAASETSAVIMASAKCSTEMVMPLRRRGCSKAASS